MPIDYNRKCPHCGATLEPWMGPPETGWGEILVCNSMTCPYFLNSNDCLVEQGAKEMLGFRYAENPDNNYAPFNLVCYCGHLVKERAKQLAEQEQTAKDKDGR